LSTGVLCLLSVLATARNAQAQTRERPRIWDRLTLDWGYRLTAGKEAVGIDYYAYNPATQRQAAALVDVRHVGAAQSVVLAAAYSFRPWFGLGLDGLAEEGFTAPSHPWFPELAISYSRRKSLGLGVFAEFRPWDRSFARRHSGFFQAGLRHVWSEYEVTRGPTVVTPKSDEHSRAMFGWLGAGYRVALGSGMSLHALVDAGLAFESLYAGMRLGGGFH
jgi:hypothetical protein